MTRRSNVPETTPGGTSRLWDAYAAVYDMGVRDLAPYRQLQADVLKRVRREVRRLRAAAGNGPIRLLDLCCGTGNHLHTVLKEVPGLCATGVDLSESMLARARRKCAPLGRVRWLCGDALDTLTHLEAGGFDLAVLCNGFYAQPRKPELLAEICRILRPHGALMLTDPRQGANLWSLLSNHVRIQGPVGLYVFPFLAASFVFSLVIEGTRRNVFLTPEDTRSLLERAGFVVAYESRTYGGANHLLVARRKEER